MSRPRPVVLAGAVGIGIVVLTLAGWQLRTTVPDVATEVVEDAPFVRRVPADGHLKAVESTPVSMSGRALRRPLTIAWLVADGARVAAGDVVVRFDPTDLEEERDRGLSERSITERKIDKAEIERQGDLTNLDRDVDQSRRELDNAEQFQAVDSQLYSRMEIVESEIDTDLAHQKMAHAEASKQIQDAQSRTDLELLEISRKQAELKIRQAQDGLDGLVLTAPRAGIVVFERDWRGNRVRVGDMVWPGTPIASIPDLTRMEAEIFVLEADAGGLAPGQQATVVLEAHPERTLAATVRQVDPIAQQRLRNVPVQYFRAVLELAETDPQTMKPGARVRAEILLDQLEAAITVPRQAVVARNGDDVVFRWAGARFEPVAVELGPSSLGRVVVTAGLAAGDRIALVDPEHRSQRDEDQAPATPAVGARS